MSSSFAVGFALIVWLFLTGCRRQEGDSSPPNPPPTVAKAAVGEATLAYSVLSGKWLRPDGDYTLAITSVTEDGVMNASYLNPNPIHVGKAQASREAGGIKVLVVLEDANYPGSTYTLAYDAKTDRLTGTYYQAVAKETYDITFERLKL